MRVSVIVPVYNAEAYVRQAAKSALTQPETGEVILIEDASPDNSLQMCSALAREFAKVRLLRHSDGKNHGAGASRNLGIRNARFDYIAFLDADDFFLPGRFSVAKQLFEADPQVEGIYEAVGVHFENEAAERRWKNRTSSMLTTMTERVPPERLFETQSPIGHSGFCPSGGWVVKRSVFDKTGLFDEHLRLHQDTVMFVKLAAVGRMVPGQLGEPVAMRRVHGHNRISAPRPAIVAYRNRVAMWETLWRWGRENLSKSRQQVLLRRFIMRAAVPCKETEWRLLNHFQSLVQLMLLLLRYPGLWSGIPFLWRTYLAKFKQS